MMDTFVEPFQDTTIFCAFSDVAARLSDKMALGGGGCRLTYAELYDEALRMAHQISAVCPQREAVAIFLPNGVPFPVAALATFAAGCPMVALDPSTPDVRNASIVRRAGIKAIVVDDTTHEAAARLDPRLAQINFAAMEPGNTGSLPLCSPDDVAVISYTSGSTGEPKGVVHTHRNLLHHVRIRLTATDLAQSDRVAMLTGTTTALATNDLLSGLLSGATLFIVDLRRNGLQELIRVLRVARITTLRTLPIIMRELTKLNRDADAFASLRHVFLSSDRLFSADVDLLRSVLPVNCRLSVSMGSTETQLIAHWFIDRNRPMVEPIVPVGHIQPDFQLTFVNDQDVPVAPGMVGEILVTSRYIALGYWRDELETKRVFSSSRGDPQARTYRTGDLGRINAEGLLELRGRKDRQIKIRGNRIEPLEVEATIRTHPDVRDVAIVTRYQADDPELVAYIVLRRNGHLLSDDLAAWLRERLQESMRPRHIYLIDEIPTLGNYKQDLRALAELDCRRTGPAQKRRSPAVVREAATSGDVAEAVRQVWARLLGDAAVDENKPWEAGHGDSLKALELIFELETVLNRRISTLCIGPLTRPKDLIARLQAVETDGPSRIPSDSKPLVFLLPGAGGFFLDLVRFAEALSSVANVQALEYAPIHPRSLRIIEFNELVSDVIAPIRAAARRGEPVRLLGHSLGGFVAIEVASTLAREGHAIECAG
jgi:amino acid adenylation domain-containing protein